MTAARPVPVALCIRHPVVAEIVSKTLLPEYETVQVFHDGDSLRRQLPRKLEGLPEEIKPGSDTNSTNPRVVVVGGAIDDDIITTFRQLSGSDRVLWLQDSKSLSGEVEKLPNLEELGVSSGVRMKKCLVDHGVVFETGRVVGAGELWLY